MTTAAIQLGRGDGLIIVDLQNDFLPGGSLAVPDGDAVIPVLNKYISYFQKALLPIYATRDWHAPDHCSFKPQGGIWPPHCVAGTAGAQFSPNLALPENAIVVSKATRQDMDAYSGFEGTDLNDALKNAGVKRVFIGGLATDYCVLNTVKDAVRNGFPVVLLTDAIRAVDVKPGDGTKAIQEMKGLGVRLASLSDFSD